MRSFEYSFICLSIGRRTHYNKESHKNQDELRLSNIEYLKINEKSTWNAVKNFATDQGEKNLKHSESIPVELSI